MLSDRSTFEIIAALLFWCACVFISLRSFVPSRRVVLSIVLRVLLASALCLLFVAPYRAKIVATPRSITALLDDSFSMGERNWRRAIELARELEKVASERGARVDVRTTNGARFDDLRAAEKRVPQGLRSPLRDAMSRDERVFVFSDGAVRDVAENARENARAPRERVDCVILGTTAQGPDVRLEDGSASSIGDDEFAPRATARVWGLDANAELIANLWALERDGSFRSIALRSFFVLDGADGVASVPIELSVAREEIESSETNGYLLTVAEASDASKTSPNAFLKGASVVSTSTKERFLLNNALLFERRREMKKLNVLLVGEYPNYEYRYLRETLRREKESVALRTILFSADPRAVASDPLALTFEELDAERASSFDVVLIGSVSDECWRGRFGVLADAALKEDGATSLWFLGGARSTDERLAVGRRFSDRDETRIGAWRLRATPLGRRVFSDSELSSFFDRSDADDPTTDRSELTALFPSVSPSVNTETLLVARAADNAEETPILTVESLGRAKIAYCATDELWRLWTLEDKNVYRKFVLRTLEYLTSETRKEGDETTLVLSRDEERAERDAEASDLAVRIAAFEELAAQTNGAVLDLRERDDATSLAQARAFFEESLNAPRASLEERAVPLAPIKIFAPLVLVLLAVLTLVEGVRRSREA